MHPSNFTLYQLVKYHIELTEAMEYTLITYKYNEDELIERFKFLKEDYKKGFYHKIVSKLFKNNKELTKEIKEFIKTYNKDNVSNIVTDHDLHSRIEYNKKLYLACSTSDEILQVFLNEEQIKKDLEDSLIKLIETTNDHFNLFYIFNSFNLYVSSKYVIMQGDSLYTLSYEDHKLLVALLTSFNEAINQKGLLQDILDVIEEKKKLKEDDVYELLNKISIECIKSEKQLYTDFETFTSKLEKEIEKAHN